MFKKTIFALMKAEKKSGLKLLFLALLFGGLMSVPYLVPHCGPVALVAFIPLLYMDKIASDEGIRRFWWYHYLAFLLFNIFSTFWIWFVSEVGSIVAIALNALQMSIVFALYRWSRKVFNYRWLSYLFLIVAWIAWEHVYFEIELSWPWLVLGNSFATSPSLVQWYEITGSLGGSLWILLTNILIFSLLTSRGEVHVKRLTIATSVLIVLPIATSLVRYYTIDCESGGEEIEVVVVQPNIDPFKKYGILPQEKMDDAMLSLVRQVITPQTRYIVTPETFTFDMDLDRPTAHHSFVKYLSFMEEYPNTNLLVGIFSHRLYTTISRPSHSARRSGSIWYDVYNSAVLMDAGNVYSYYHKSKLVPGVEIIPYERYLPFLSKLVSKFGGSSGSYGTQDEMDALEGNDGNKVGPMICYESVYGNFSRIAAVKGATFMAVMTNDGWWGDTPGYRQHFRYAGLRAIEMRRDVVHAANTGISGIINRRGDVIIRTGWWEETSFRGNINTNDNLTPFFCYGDLIGLVAAYCFLPFTAGVIIVQICRRRKSKQ